VQQLLQQRCSRHQQREAVARCLECGRFFCRECVTEHQGRLLCSACLSKQIDSKPRGRGSAAIVLRAAQFLSGALTIWIFFYLIGHLLLSIPSDFHDGTIWKTGLR